MRHKRIVDVFTIIYKGRQKVGFEVEGLNKYLFLAPSNVRQCANVEIYEVEILIGSTIRPVFYSEGEKMLNGKIFMGGQYILKNFWIECSGSLNEMRLKNKNKIKPLKTVHKVFQFTRNDRLVTGFDTGDEKATFINTNRLIGLTKMDPDEFHILEGSFIYPEYYNKGDTLFNGEKCMKSGILLKALNLRYFGTISEMHERFEHNNEYLMSDNRDFDYSSDENYDELTLEVAFEGDASLMWNIW